MTHDSDLTKPLTDLAVKTVRLANLLPTTVVGQFAAEKLLTNGTRPAIALVGSAKQDPAVLADCLTAVQQTFVWLNVILEAELAPIGRVRALLRECEMRELALAAAIKQAETQA